METSVNVIIFLAIAMINLFVPVQVMVRANVVFVFVKSHGVVLLVIAECLMTRALQKT